MFSEKTSIRRMIAFLENDATKPEITTICVHAQRLGADELSVHGTRDQLLCGLAAIDRDILAEAIEIVFSSDEEEESADEAREESNPNENCGFDDDDDECYSEADEDEDD